MTETQRTYSYTTDKMFKNLVLRGLALILGKLYGVDMPGAVNDFQNDVNAYRSSVAAAEERGLGAYRG